MAVADRANPVSWESKVDDALSRIEGCFARVEPEATSNALFSGLLSAIGQKVCWCPAEHAGRRAWTGCIGFSATSTGNADARDDVLGFVAEHLGHPSEVLGIDETGFMKRHQPGRAATAIHRKRPEGDRECHMAVFAAVAGQYGQVTIGRGPTCSRSCDTPTLSDAPQQKCLPTPYTTHSNESGSTRVRNCVAVTMHEETRSPEKSAAMG